jgi:hypothetical protein
MFLRGDEFVMGFERQITNHGCDSPDGVAVLRNSHFFADSGDIRVFDGQTTESVTAFVVRNSLAIGISDEFRDRTIVVSWPQRDEIWVAAVSAGADTADVVLVFSAIHGGWTTKNYPGTYSMVVGPYAATAETESQIWDDAETSWDDTDQRWNFSPLNPVEDGVIFGLKTTELNVVVWGSGIAWGDGSLWAEEGTEVWRGGSIVRVGLGNTKANDEPKYCVAERTGFVMTDLQQNVTLKAVYPEMEGDGPVQLQVGAQRHAGDAVRWTQPQDFRPGYDKKINTRITGMPTALRVSSHADSFWRLGAVSFETTEASRR